jgi:hypothetical protein
LKRLTKDAEIIEGRIFNFMHSLSFLVVELETARTKLLDVFEAANGAPKWTWRATLSGWAGWLKNQARGEQEVAH